MEYLVYPLFVGVGATAVMDVWGFIRKPLLGQASPNYGLVGRWLVHMRHGRFHHQSIAAATPVRGEIVSGWIAHYLTGIAFAALLICIGGAEWIRHPSLSLALAVGIGSIAAPFLLMQPGMGAGLAASRMPNPAAARIQSLVTHTVFGLGLYATGWAGRFFYLS